MKMRALSFPSRMMTTDYTDNGQIGLLILYHNNDRKSCHTIRELWVSLSFSRSRFRPTSQWRRLFLVNRRTIWGVALLLSLEEGWKGKVVSAAVILANDWLVVTFFFLFRGGWFGCTPTPLGQG